MISLIFVEGEEAKMFQLLPAHRLIDGRDGRISDDLCASVSACLSRFEIFGFPAVADAAG